MLPLSLNSIPSGINLTGWLGTPSSPSFRITVARRRQKLIIYFISIPFRPYFVIIFSGNSCRHRWIPKSFQPWKQFNSSFTQRYTRANTFQVDTLANGSARVPPSSVPSLLTLNTFYLFGWLAGWLVGWVPRCHVSVFGKYIFKNVNLMITAMICTFE